VKLLTRFLVEATNSYLSDSFTVGDVMALQLLFS
jgi:hypothetical protein